jgi:hypothetical protein
MASLSTRRGFVTLRELENPRTRIAKLILATTTRTTNRKTQSAIYLPLTAAAKSQQNAGVLEYGV